MSNLPKARITGLGSYLPTKILSNQDLEKIVETTDEWIVSRTGMKERRIAAADEYTSDMGLKAAQKALSEAKKTATDLDLILMATMTPDYITPSTAAVVQAKLGASKAAAVDVQAACTGFLYALAQAKAFIESGIYKNILVIASEKMSTYVDYKDRNTCVLFGDGAAAAVVTDKGEGYKIDNVCLGADGELAELLILPGGGTRNPPTHEMIDQNLHTIKMVGKEVFKHAVRRMSAAAKECLDKAGLKEDQIEWLVPHQANVRIIDAISKHFNVSDEKVYKTVHKYGNTSASSIAIALDELLKQEKMAEGAHILLVAFGAGLTWGASILTKIRG